MGGKANSAGKISVHQTPPQPSKGNKGMAECKRGKPLVGREVGKKDAGELPGRDRGPHLTKGVEAICEVGPRITQQPGGKESDLSIWIRANLQTFDGRRARRDVTDL